MAEQLDAAYRPGLDGVRAIAVSAVLAFHLGRLPGGNLGVDAFFVLSGWLITWKLLDEAGLNGAIGLRRFWAARLRRLMPAAMAVLFAVAVVWPLAGIDVPSLRRDVVWAAGWASNWGTITNGGDYWARFGEQSPVTHFWSLAIEEQFYLVWPVVVFGVVRWARPHRAVIGAVSAAAALASIMAMNALFDPANPTAAYMNTLARGHSLLIGATAAAFTPLLMDGRLRGGSAARRLAPIGAIVAAAIVAGSSADSAWLFRWGFPVFALAMMIVVVAAADGAGQRMLASPPLRWIGERSYGIYLWHWPVFLLMSPARLGTADSGLGSASADVVRVGVAVLLADVSFRVLEQPIRRQRVLRHWRAPAAAATAFAAVIIVVLAVIPSPARTSETLVVALPPPTTTATTRATTTATITAPRSTPHARLRVDQRTALDEPTVAAPSSGWLSSPAAGSAAPAVLDLAIAPEGVSFAPAAPPAPLRVLVTGDSTGVHLAEALIDYADAVPDQLIAGSAAAAGCGLSADEDGRLHEFTNAASERELIDLRGCLVQWRSVPQRIEDEAVDVLLVSIGPWDAVDIRLPNGAVVSLADADGQALVARAYERFARQIRPTGVTIVWIRPADTQLGWERVADSLNDPARWSALRAIIDSLDVVQIDLAAWLDGTGVDGPEARPDGVHLTPELNELFVVEQVAPALEEIRTRRSQACAATSGPGPCSGLDFFI